MRSNPVSQFVSAKPAGHRRFLSFAWELGSGFSPIVVVEKRQRPMDSSCRRVSLARGRTLTGALQMAPLPASRCVASVDMPKSITKSVPYSPGAQALLLAGERLFARHGIEEVSLRQIVSSAGQANSYAIQHHFGDKDGLIRAILEMRLPQLNALREARLRKLRQAGNADVRALLDALFMPLADFTDASGRHVYAAFLLRQGWDHAGNVWSREGGYVPASFEILDELATLLPSLGAKAISERLSLIVGLFLNAVIRLDAPASASMSPAARKKYLRQALDMCAAAIAAPPQR